MSVILMDYNFTAILSLHPVRRPNPINIKCGLIVTMTYDEFNQFCGSLPATSYVMQWGDSHVWKVGGKVFAVGGWEKTGNNPAYTFKTSDFEFHLLSDQPGYRPAPYLASRGMKWIQQFDDDAALDDDLKYFLKESHRIVSLGLSKKKQKELGLNQE